MPILRIAEFDKNRFFVASIRRDISDPNKQCAIHLSTARVEWRFARQKWYHLSLVKDERRVRFFVDNTIIDSMDCEQLKPYDAPKVSVCIFSLSSYTPDLCFAVSVLEAPVVYRAVFVGR